MSWRFWFEGESGLAEEFGNESGPSLDAVQLVPHRGGELVCGAGGEVAQAVLHHRPGALGPLAGLPTARGLPQATT